MAKKTAQEVQSEYQDRYPTISEIIVELDDLIRIIGTDSNDTTDAQKLLNRLRRIENSAVIFEP